MAFENEWSTLNRMSAEMAGLRNELDYLRARYDSLQNELSAIVPDYDEEGNDLTEAYRASIEADISRTERQINAAENQIYSISSNASSMASRYSNGSAEYTRLASDHNQAASQLQGLTNYRFGAATARAGSNAAAQHSQHYNSLANEMMKLASAAQQVATGGSPSGGPGEISAYGGFSNPTTSSRGGQGAGGKANHSTVSSGNPHGARGTGGKTVSQGQQVRPSNGDPEHSETQTRLDSGRRVVNDSMLGFLAMHGLPSNNGQPDFSSVSHGTVSGDFSGSDTNNKADAAFAKQNGMSIQDACNYRTQNNLAWAVNSTGTQANLVPTSIVGTYSNHSPAASAPARADSKAGSSIAHTNQYNDELLNFALKTNTKEGYRAYLKTANLVANADFGNLDVRTARDITLGIYETKEMFPDLDLRFTGSLQSRNDIIEKGLTDMYMDSLRQANPGVPDQMLQPTAQQFVAKTMRQLEPSQRTIAASITNNNLEGFPDSVIEAMNSITINEAYGNNYESFVKVREGNVNSGWKPQNCYSPKATVDHELGHQIDYMVNARNDPDIITWYNDFMKIDDAKKGSVLSGYAADKIEEFIAESWSEYRNNPQCRECAKKVSEKMIKLYDEKKAPVLSKILRRKT